MTDLIREFRRQLAIQRWDDHRYYHQSRINQTLHLISALSFLVAYGLLFIDPAAAALVGWLVSMTTRQAGHFFFEPLGFDHVNQATNEHKEAIKVGYNLRRKVVLLSAWVLLPALLWVDRSLLGLIEPSTGFAGWVHDVGLLWLALGVGGLLFRTLHLFVLKSPLEGLVWMTKILTDPFHDVYLYHKAPLALLRGERLDPMTHVRQVMAAQAAPKSDDDGEAAVELQR
ncbi:hypothetical protein [Rubrivivax albus]|uniref:hypothetical protein n=1 Tax=Rubrivivax albus TaxID=2499835 RepID=UPI001E64B253|nr:hypothetical protein [Rubrivivax albus]